MTIRTAAPALVAGGIIVTAGGVAWQIANASTSVSEDMYRHPWSSGAFIVVALAAATAFALEAAGLTRLRASAPAGGTRTGLAVAAAGTAIVGGAHLASIAARSEAEDAGIATVVVIGFATGTLLVAGGLIAAGRAGLRAGWEGASRACCSRPDSGRSA